MSEILTLKSAQTNNDIKISLNSVKDVTMYGQGVFKVFLDNNMHHLVFKHDALIPFIKPIVQLALFTDNDYKAAQEAKDKGMDKAIKNAEKMQDGWADSAEEVFTMFINNLDKDQEFMTEDVRGYAELTGIILSPPSNRAWGTVTNRMVRKGLIVKVGLRSVKNPKANMSYANVWKKA